MAWLLDTNVGSEANRFRPDPRVMAFLKAKSGELFISTVTLAEIRFGIITATDADKRYRLQHWLDLILRPMFEDRVFGLTEDTLLLWRETVEAGRKSGKTYPEPDLLMAAVAMEHSLTLVTRNVKDFAGLDLDILNPWESEL